MKLSSAPVLEAQFEVKARHRSLRRGVMGRAVSVAAGSTSREPVQRNQLLWRAAPGTGAIFGCQRQLMLTLVA
jgi:hypothetical protein